VHAVERPDVVDRRPDGDDREGPRRVGVSG
jgi:hypothetical protein